MPLAIDEDWVYEEISLEIPENSRLLIYTDGLDEAFPADGDQVHDQFGMKGIINSLKRTKDLPLDKALDALFDDSNAATAGSGRHDGWGTVAIADDALGIVWLRGDAYSAYSPPNFL